MNRANRSQAIFYAVALMIFGGVIGYMIKSATTATPQSLRLGRVDEIATIISARLNDKLELTAEQKQRLEPMIKKAAEEMEAAHLDCLKRVNKIADDLYTQIKPELIAEQQAKLKELETDRAQRMKEKYNYQPAALSSTRH